MYYLLKERHTAINVICACSEVTFSLNWNHCPKHLLNHMTGGQALVLESCGQQSQCKLSRKWQTGIWGAVGSGALGCRRTGGLGLAAGGLRLAALLGGNCHQLLNPQGCRRSYSLCEGQLTKSAGFYQQQIEEKQVQKYLKTHPGNQNRCIHL